MKKSSYLSQLCLVLAFLLFTVFPGFTQDDTRGDLVVVDAEYVSPEYLHDYVQWGKEFKALADKVNFRSFYVSSDDQAFYYVWPIGKDMSGIDKIDADFADLIKTNPEVVDMVKKYSHSMTHRTRVVWRHDPGNSYSPEGYDPNFKSTYSRFYTGYVKFGHSQAIKELMKEFKEIWASAGISHAYQAYWNVMGQEQPCVMYITAYKDRQSWVDEQNEVNEKIGMEKLQSLLDRWNSHIRKNVDAEGMERADLSHFKN